MNSKYRIIFGIHRGTLVSRDTGEEEADSREEALAKAGVIRRTYPDGFGYKLWFIEVRDPDNNVIRQINGEPYER